MSNYHLLESDLKNKYVKAVFHIVIPDKLNIAGISYRNCYKLQKGIINSEVKDLETSFPAEFSDLQNGIILEHSTNISLGDVKQTWLTKRNILNKFYKDLLKNIIKKLENELRFYGFSTNVSESKKRSKK